MIDLVKSALLGFVAFGILVVGSFAVAWLGLWGLLLYLAGIGISAYLVIKAIDILCKWMYL